MKRKSRHHLKGSEARKIIADLENLLEDPSSLQEATLERAEAAEGIDLVYVDGRPLLMMVEGFPFFTILGAIELPIKKKLVVVDSGAVRFIVNGADVMNPGIVAADPEIAAGDLVVVIEEKYRKPLAIGLALVSGQDMKGEGKAVKSLHHVGDHIWKEMER